MRFQNSFPVTLIYTAFLLVLETRIKYIMFYSKKLEKIAIFLTVKSTDLPLR